MSRISAVQRNRSPLVVENPYFLAVLSNHGLDGTHHALLQPRPMSEFSIVRHLRFFVQLAPDTVTYKFPYHGTALNLHTLLDRGGNVFEPVAEAGPSRSEEHTSELQSPDHLVCRLLLEKKKRC